MSAMHDDSVWTVILAAGASRRFKSGIKALAPWGQGTLLSQAIDTARAVSGSRVLVVTGAHRAVIEPAATALTVYNEKWEDGMGASIACGLRAVLSREPDAAAVLIMPVDQPHIHAAHLSALLQGARQGQGAALSGDGAIVAPPAAITPPCYDAALSLQGERGLKSVLENYAVITDAAVLADFDENVPGT